MDMENILKLTTVADKETCLACYEETNNRVTCCNTAICKTCYLKWLEQKRQCMHCKEDQCDFDLWMQEYRIEPEFDPHEYLHNLLLQENGIVGTNPLLTNAQGFGIENLLALIASQLENQENPFNLLEPGDLPDADEEFAFEFGFTLAPTDADGNQLGPGITVTQNMNHPGNGSEDLYNQLQTAMNHYRNLFEQWNGDMNSPPDDMDDEIDQSDDEYQPNPIVLDWPWEINNNEQPPNCTHQ